MSLYETVVPHSVDSVEKVHGLLMRVPKGVSFVRFDFGHTDDVEPVLCESIVAGAVARADKVWIVNASQVNEDRLRTAAASFSVEDRIGFVTSAH